MIKMLFNWKLHTMRSPLGSYQSVKQCLRLFVIACSSSWLSSITKQNTFSKHRPTDDDDDDGDNKRHWPSSTAATGSPLKVYCLCVYMFYIWVEQYFNPMCLLSHICVCAEVCRRTICVYRNICWAARRFALCGCCSVRCFKEAKPDGMKAPKTKSNKRTRNTTWCEQAILFDFVWYLIYVIDHTLVFVA